MTVPRFALALLAGTVLASCAKKEEAVATTQTAPVTRQDIVVDAAASGAIEPINVVEVKSKSSGQIVKMTVETGSLVQAGDLLVQLETRDVQNQFDQSQADLRAAEAKLAVSESQKKRADGLFQQRIITAQEHETAQIDYANSQAAIIRARTSLDLAQQRLDDATVRAPGVGTVIEKTVSLGQVITSATNSASGGSVLLKMADLTRVRMRALFNETDIGNVRPGQQTTVRVDAYPDRPFTGTVEKIEPQAVVQQSVTMFPVLVSLSNESGLLKPGMNGEAAVLVEERLGVLAVPNDAVRTAREAPMLASAMNLDPDSVQAQVQAQMAAMMGGMGGGNFGGSRGPSQGGAGQPRGTRSMQGEVDLPPQGNQGGPGGQRPQVSEEACAKYRDAVAKKPEVAQKLTALRQRAMSGEIDFAAMRAEAEPLYRELGVEASVAGGCARRQGGADPRGGSGAQQGAAGQPGGGQPAARSGAGGPGAARQGTAAQRGQAVPEQGGEFPARSRARSGVVFVAQAGGFAPRVVRIGLANFDFTEVVSGLKEGEQVALLAAAALQAGRDSSNARFRQMTGGGGVPGMSKNTAVPGGTGGGGMPGGGRRP